MTEQQPTANHPMNAYEISEHPDGSGYDVHIAGFDGARQTILNFKTRADADDWIAADRAKDRAEGKSG